MHNLISAITQLDIRCFRWCLSKADRMRIFHFSRGISHLGDGVYYLLLGIVLIYIEPAQGKAFFLTGLAAFAMELPAYAILKNAIKRSRPEDVIQEFVAYIIPSDKFSFPSGHTAAAFVMATLVGYFYPTYATWAFILAVLIGFSRVILGVHFISDILAGAVFGTVVAMTAVSWVN